MIRRILTIAAAVGLCTGAGFLAGWILAGREPVADQLKATVR